MIKNKTETRYKMEDNFYSQYGNKKYDPQWYKIRILETINDALKNGIRLDYLDDVLGIENTTSEEETTINFNEILE